MNENNKAQIIILMPGVPHRCGRIPLQLALSLEDIGKQGQERHRQSLYPDVLSIEDYLVAVNQEFRADTDEPVYIRPGNPGLPDNRTRI